MRIMLLKKEKINNNFSNRLSYFTYLISTCNVSKMKKKEKYKNFQLNLTSLKKQLTSPDVKFSIGILDINPVDHNLKVYLLTVLITSILSSDI